MFNGDENKKSPIASKANRFGLLYGWRWLSRRRPATSRTTADAFYLIP
jgi:hypothetical protein